MAGEIQKASERYEARKRAAGLRAGDGLTDEVMAILVSDLDLDPKEMRLAKDVVRAAVVSLIATGKTDLQNLGIGFWVDGLIVGIFLQQARA